MEEAKKIDISNRPIEAKNVDPGCPIWIFGDEKSADTDMKEKFNIIDDEKKD